MRKSLTLKQRKFVAAYIKTGNGTRAALGAYETRDSNIAHAIASQNLRKLTVQKAISEMMEESGMDDESLQRIHQELLASEEEAIRLKALDMAYRLRGSYAPVKTDTLIRPVTGEEREERFYGTLEMLKRIENETR